MDAGLAGVQAAPGDPAGALAAMQRLRQLSRQRQTRALTDEERAALDESGGPCAHCGGYHSRACPRVKRIEWHPNGLISSVEFWPDHEVNWDGVVFDDAGPDEGDALSPDVVADIRHLAEAARGAAPWPVIRRVEAWLESLPTSAVQSSGEA